MNSVKKVLTSIVLFLIILMSLAGCTIARQKQVDEILLVQYFYENICGSCTPEEEFLENFEEYTNISTKTPNLKIEMYNVYEENDYNVWEKTSKEFDLQYDTFPILRIGNEFQLCNELKETLNNSDLLSALDDDMIIPNNASVIIYFSSPGCHDCMEVEENILSLLPSEITIDNKISPIKTIKISTAENGSINIFKKYCEEFRVSKDKQKTPLVIVGYMALSGPNEIAQLPELIQQGNGQKTPLFLAKEQENEKLLLSYGWLGVIVTGLINGVNPCAISMVLMLLSLLVVDKKLIAPVGFAFATGKFIGFFLLGTVLFSVVDKLPLNQLAFVTKIILLLLSGLMILLNLNDFLAAKNEKYKRIRLQLPKNLRKRNHDWIKKLLSAKQRGLLIAGGILLGLIMAAGEFLCTGQIYLAVIVQIAHSGAELSGRALIYLLVYCVAFIIPLLIMVLLVSKGRKVFNLSDKFRRKMTWIKLLNMVIFIIFFVLVLFDL